MTLLKAHELSLAFGVGHSIFERRSFEMGAGEKVVLVGPSGSGKTLFLRSLCLLEPDTTGEIYWKDERVVESQILFYRSRVMYLGQRTALPLGTVEAAFDEFFQFRIHRGKSWNREKTLEALKFFGKSAGFLSKRTEQLSGGEKQLVNLLRTLALGPEVLCLDEPTSALDVATTRKVEEWVSQEHRTGWIWVTHQEDQMLRVGERQIRF